MSLTDYRRFKQRAIEPMNAVSGKNELGLDDGIEMTGRYGQRPPVIKSLRMGDQQLSLREVKEQAKALGYTRIQRQKKRAPIVELAAWNGVSAEAAAGGAFSHVAVWYRLDGDQVTVNKSGEPDIYYVLS
jgi:hypothetical protein